MILNGNKGYFDFLVVFHKSAGAGRVFGPVTSVVGANDSPGDCDSNTACKSMLSSCLAGCGVAAVGSELAIVGSVGSCKTTSLGVT